MGPVSGPGKQNPWKNTHLRVRVPETGDTMRPQFWGPAPQPQLAPHDACKQDFRATFDRRSSRPTGSSKRKRMWRPPNLALHLLAHTRRQLEVAISWTSSIPYPNHCSSLACCIPKPAAGSALRYPSSCFGSGPMWPADIRVRTSLLSFARWREGGAVAVSP